MSPPGRGLRVAFVAGLSDKKLRQKLAPLAALPQVERIDLYRREPFAGLDKVVAHPVSSLGRRVAAIGEMERLVRLLADARHCDLLVGCFQVYHGIWAWLAGAVFGKPVVQLVLSDVDWNSGRPLAWAAMLRAGACGVRGPGSLAKLRGYGFTGPAAVLHNPVDPAELDAPPAVGDKRFDVIAVGDAAWEKDYPWMLEVLTRLRTARPGLRVLLCGQGLREFCSGLPEWAQLADCLEFPGRLGRADLDRAFAQSRCLLLTSRIEGLPMVVVEAMVRGLPVFVTRVGELPWLVQDSLHGRVLPHGDTGAMGQALAQALDAPEALAEMGTNARERIRELAEEFSTRRIASAWLGLLRGLGLTDES